jgi:hypothetical protein
MATSSQRNGLYVATSYAVIDVAGIGVEFGADPHSWSPGNTSCVSWTRSPPASDPVGGDADVALAAETVWFLSAVPRRRTNAPVHAGERLASHVC